MCYGAQEARIPIVPVAAGSKRSLQKTNECRRAMRPHGNNCRGTRRMRCDSPVSRGFRSLKSPGDPARRKVSLRAAERYGSQHRRRVPPVGMKRAGAPDGLFQDPSVP